MRGAGLRMPASSMPVRTPCDGGGRMQIALSLLVLFFVVVVGLWPLACLAAVVHHAMRRRWRAIGQLALLLPLWTIAASVVALQLAPLLARAEAASSPTATLVAATGVGVAVC